MGAAAEGGEAAAAAAAVMVGERERMMWVRSTEKKRIISNH